MRANRTATRRGLDRTAQIGFNKVSHGTVICRVAAKTSAAHHLTDAALAAPDKDTVSPSMNT
jgi:hypothetical protein